MERAETAAEGLRLAGGARAGRGAAGPRPAGHGREEAWKKLRGFSAVPVIVLSARDREAEKIAALDGGADDYLEKPFAVGNCGAHPRGPAPAPRERPTAASQESWGTLLLQLAEQRGRVADDGVERRVRLLWAASPARPAPHIKLHCVCLHVDDDISRCVYWRVVNNGYVVDPNHDEL